MQRPILQPKHFEELIKGSGIDSNLISLNFTFLQNNTPYEYLFISNRLPRTNNGQISSAWLRRYAFIKWGGWWCSGLDPLNNWELMEWGCFKPNKPRQNKNRKPIKYEHPPLTPTRLFCLRITLPIWQQIATRYNLSLPKNITPSQDGEAFGFWEWAVKNKLPIILCEGVKKAAALLTLGYAAIALPGITSGYRVTKDPQGKILSRQLIPELAFFTQLSPTFYICFDYETQPKTIKAVNNAITHLGQLLEQQNCPVKVINLPGTEKGVDEFIVERGKLAFENIYAQSLDLETHLAKSKPHSQLTYPPSLTLQQRYLGKLPFPKSGLVGIKSPKGTGKTTALLEPVQQAKKTKRPVLLLTHRIQLGRFLCDKIGVKWIKNDLLKKPLSTLPNSLGLCLDSVWKLNPADWQGAIVILDEFEQSLWHLLNSNTCKEKRVKLLKTFQNLISTVLKTGGLIIAQDADLSDLSLDYLKSLSTQKIEPWVVVNEWKPQTGWNIDFYESPNPTPLIHQLEQDLMAGLKCYVTTDSRSGRYSCETIERYIKQRLEIFQKRYPKTLVISSHTINTPNHEAMRFTEAINQKACKYEAVFVTPSLGTGISIDVAHFDRVYGIFQGVIPDPEARQALARVRPNVPRLIWCAKRGIGFIGSGSKNYRVLAEWYQLSSKENLALMNPFYQVDVDFPFVCDFIHLRCWAKLAARVNASISLYRQSMLEGLLSEGHQVNRITEASCTERIAALRKAFLLTKSEDFPCQKKLILEIFKLQKQLEKQATNAKNVKDQILKLQQQIEWRTAEAIAGADDLSSFEYERLLAKRSLSDEERYQTHKHFLKQRYGVPVTPELKIRDDRGYYSQLLTHYYLTHKNQYFQLRDQQEWNQQLQRGEGQVFLPDLENHTLKIEVLRALGAEKFLQPNRQFKETDPDLITLKDQAIKYAKHIKRATAINIPLDTEKQPITAIQILRQLLRLLGLKLKRSNNLYQIDAATLNDGRQAIFEMWRTQDILKTNSYFPNVETLIPNYLSKKQAQTSEHLTFA
ncbi:DUF3854 domain-containing protein [Ancylothrix sp. C2]|uniref:plasmid replication protein, CyRepA1 family n=1 Tax=Ancylothrix sp. D3o TaxID=2953691 RepID=UPI0021BBB2A6|nr:plasmid replication protein, CyRepA1 family [Ancylothrix sp. D3o]MCT7950622.1 DUF3854 domain-containing protein [Ancylothrix sp. D3o]